MGQIEELPNDLDEKLDLNDAACARAAATGPSPPPDLIDQILSQPSPFPVKTPSTSQDASSSSSASPNAMPGPEMPPAMSSIRQYSAEEVVSMLNRTPLFMTTLDETDGSGGENVELEALKALAYEGSKAEVADNFREQGNEMARAKQWAEARGYYDQALGVLSGTAKTRDPQEEEEEVVEPEMDLREKGSAKRGAQAEEEESKREAQDEEERRKEKEIEEKCWVNRALCNLELKNYRATLQDCAHTLQLNPNNLKALHRSALALLALHRPSDARLPINRALTLHPSHPSLTALLPRLSALEAQLTAQRTAASTRSAALRARAAALRAALTTRGIVSRDTAEPPDLQDAQPCLAVEGDPASELSVPVLVLYPLEGETDFLKRVAEGDRVGAVLDVVLPTPWDRVGEYARGEGVLCFAAAASTTAATAVAAGGSGSGSGLVKVGRKMTVGGVLGSGKVELVDGLLTLYVLPREKAAAWVEEFKRRGGGRRL